MSVIPLLFAFLVGGLLPGAGSELLVVGVAALEDGEAPRGPNIPVHARRTDLYSTPFEGFL